MAINKNFFGPMRVPFLILTPACVLLGVATAVRSGVPVNPLQVLIVLIGAVCTHISVNAFNEYEDFRSGLDTRTQRTPFSGGSGTLPADPGMARSTLAIALGAFSIVALTGIYFTWQRGLALLPLGLVGMLVILAYTPWLTKNPVLCLVAPGLGFGPFMVMGTHFALVGKYSLTSFAASLVPFFLVSNLLLLNQFPDVDADRTVGRKHFPILIGRHLSSIIFSTFLVLTYLAILFGVAFAVLPLGALLGLLTLVIAIPLLRGSIMHADDIHNLIPFMGKNVLINLLTPVLVAIGLFIH
jgi:1,4-dihydroxy-2-naphthoate octaprenyltransferase